MTLDREDVEAVAVRVAELLDERGQPPQPMLDVDGVARLLDVSRDYVYRNAARLGGRKLSGGRKAPLRFLISDVLAATPSLASKEPSGASTRTAARKGRGRPPGRMGTTTPLLPIHEPRAAR